jgi:hypothetical protein
VEPGHGRDNGTISHLKKDASCLENVLQHYWTKSSVFADPMRVTSAVGRKNNRKIVEIGLFFILFLSLKMLTRLGLECCVMLFFLRMAFWITLIWLLLPGSRESNQRLISSAEQTVNDVKGFCQRNPQVCENARSGMTELLVRLKSGVEIFHAWLVKQGVDKAEQPPPAIERGPRKVGRYDQPVPQPVTKWQNSLNSADKQVPWRGPGF